jgi:phosphatidylinositol alpha-1,6-mannosyltransferase
LVTPIVYALGLMCSLPSVVYVHGLDLIYSHPLYQWMIKQLLPRCDRVLANSRASSQEAIERGVQPDRISVLHPGLEITEFEAVPDLDSVRRAYDLEGRLVLLSVGRLAKRKGLVEFVRHSLPTIVTEHPDAIFVVVGGNPSLSLTHKEDIKSRIEAEARRLGLTEHVRLLGWIDRADLMSLYHVCDVFVLPAIHVRGDMEGFGIVLIEASAAGKPVVSTKLGGITDAVVDGEGGTLVEPEQWGEFSDAVMSLLEDEALRQAMGESGRRRVRTELDWCILARRYAEELRCLLETDQA